MTLTLPATERKLNIWPGLIEAYRDYLPVTSATPVVTLQEGNTPLIPVPTIAAEIGKQVQVYVKYDGLNPTGSFKDRGMTMAISKAKEEGAKAVICASTGNTSASAAAYARRAGLKAFVVIPYGYVALGKLAQALLYGAEVLAIEGNFDEALTIVREVSRQYPVTLVNSVNPYRLEGQKTAAFEVVDALGDAPDWLCIPVGNAGNITAYWMGFCQYHSEGKCDRLPRMMGFQAAGAAPIVNGQPVPHPETIATAIRIGNPASWDMAIAAQSASQGSFSAVTDEEILNAYRLLASQEGIFCEPASASSVAGLLKVKDQVPAGATVVCVLTGNGLKDPDVAINHSNNPTKEGIAANLDAVAKAMGF
ncbi:MULTISPECIES: threonine synthase [Arthrospira]|jgi:threonine synthase|uniref:Threonine synthase n=1 Tax=Limnospira platensis NIES-46 TaxID=1236695 RepID=A0A5M3TDV1_LIMPL|nr:MULTISPECIES: threonine synthase [Arthrospira]AMW27072.1 threonine synthase [Arthrospira platensis YZ]KDR57086.1 threonine synthase [Arthrospira platensis str. Paraca]MBD2669953.1 threonine synthase [Arthrospira platensis FACHB-439]MBD2710532.1 threonine synthase [Arthrospira platensis FACHB-835]MDF2211468.1 threonine synthase [Arthrospira platensis NCB002]MDT9181942.1 threonine synthase [Limnospira sp. PMC 289.06]MDT9295255.1 threonine synthase [Arthrospira platensis PCC 7345]MDT9309785